MPSNHFFKMDGTQNRLFFKNVMVNYTVEDRLMIRDQFLRGLMLLNLTRKMGLKFRSISSFALKEWKNRDLKVLMKLFWEEQTSSEKEIGS